MEGIRTTIQLAVWQRIEDIMIGQADIIEIDRSYFEIVEKRDFVLVLRSLSTGHYWCLLEQIYNGCRTFQILHKHKEAEPYHPQKNRPSVLACCDYIKSHDAYQLRKEREKEESRQRRKEEDRQDFPGPGLWAAWLFRRPGGNDRGTGQGDESL